MEEVDKIILDSLRNLECDIGPDIEHLKQFDADMVVSSVSVCLEAILHVPFPKKLPTSMSLRLKIASNLAEQIKDLGFRGDMGYQTILYCNEEEVRRVLMYLIERLPRESVKTESVEQIGYVPKIIKSLQENIKESLSRLWVPAQFLKQGVYALDKGYIVSNLGHSCPLISRKLTIPDSQTQNEDLKEYWIHYISDVTKQCPPKYLIPSLLYEDLEFPDNINLQHIIKSSEIVSLKNTETTISIPLMTENSDINVTKKKENKEMEIQTEENKIENLSQALENVKEQYLTLQDHVKSKETLLRELIRTKHKEEDYLKETIAKIKLKSKTQAVLSKEENFGKLSAMIEKSNNRLIEMAKQWNDIQAPLLEEYKLLKSTLTSEESKCQKQKEKMDHLVDTGIKLKQDLKEKKVLAQNLVQQLQQINKGNNRSLYTRRILEIIGNINKQNTDIQKILKDTHEVQREIKNLTGQVDRSFTLADELIFFDAKHDETARRSYKLLAALRDEFNDILKTLEELGQVERECRNLEEQIEIEKSKEIAMKLQRVTSDLKLIQKETEMLKNQSKNKS